MIWIPRYRHNFPSIWSADLSVYHFKKTGNKKEQRHDLAYEMLPRWSAIITIIMIVLLQRVFLFCFFLFEYAKAVSIRIAIAHCALSCPNSRRFIYRPYVVTSIRRYTFFRASCCWELSLRWWENNSPRISAGVIHQFVIVIKIQLYSLLIAWLLSRSQTYFLFAKFHLSSWWEKSCTVLYSISDEIDLDDLPSFQFVYCLEHEYHWFQTWHHYSR